MEATNNLLNVYNRQIMELVNKGVSVLKDVNVIIFSDDKSDEALGSLCATICCCCGAKSIGYYLVESSWCCLKDFFLTCECCLGIEDCCECFVCGSETSSETNGCVEYCKCSYYLFHNGDCWDFDDCCGCCITKDALCSCCEDSKCSCALCGNSCCGCEECTFCSTQALLTCNDTSCCTGEGCNNC